MLKEFRKNIFVNHYNFFQIKEAEPQSQAKIKKETKSNVSVHEEMEVDEEEEDEGDADEEDEESSTNIQTSLSGKRNHPLVIAMWTLFRFIKDNELSEPFVKLPSKKLYPDYYEDIKQPICLNNIKSKLKLRSYTSLNELTKELNLVFANAMQYNLEDSIIYDHAKKLTKALNEKSAELALTEVGNLFVSKHAENASLTPMKQKTQSLLNDSKLTASPKTLNVCFILVFFPSFIYFLTQAKKNKRIKVIAKYFYFYLIFLQGELFLKYCSNSFELTQDLILMRSQLRKYTIFIFRSHNKWSKLLKKIRFQEYYW